MDRRQFLVGGALAALGAAFSGTLLGCGRKDTAPGLPATGTGAAVAPAGGGGAAGKIGANRWDPGQAGDVTLAVAQQGAPGELTRTALKNYGGISTWVKPGDRVVIKPNLAYALKPAQATDVHPEVLAAVIALCQEAQAKEILVVEHPLASAQDAFRQSGAEEVCQAAGVRLVNLGSEAQYQDIEFHAGESIQNDQIARDILECDAYINIAIAKVHSASKVTLGMKNQMGAIFNRGRYHSTGSGAAGVDNLSANIADLAIALRPTLTVIDATRALMSNGPGGPGRVEEPKAVVVSADPVAADAYACRFLKVDPATVPHIKVAAERGLGKIGEAEWKVA